MKKYIWLVIVGVIVAIGITFYMMHFRTYTVTFITKIGPGVQTQQVKKGEKVLKPKDPEGTSGYEFVEWMLDGKRYDFNLPVEKNINLEAKWVQNK